MYGNGDIVHDDNDEEDAMRHFSDLKRPSCWYEKRQCPPDNDNDNDNDEDKAMRNLLI